jgi:teichuronic acid biosynthesis glycosyltransferase TuaH
MHGEVKLRREGLRTRDAHLLEWFTRIEPALHTIVQSRPEPWPRVTLARLRGACLPQGWTMASRQPFALPSPVYRRRWWLTSRRFDIPWPQADAVAIWNPLAGAHQISSLDSGVPALLDLLDDWTAHAAFAPIADDIASAYAMLFSRCQFVTANSEATVALARRFGRDDVELIRNGCDPDRFTRVLRPHSSFTVGYGGKIGHRLDVSLITRVASTFPMWRFEFVGPTLVPSVRRQLRLLPNIAFRGDVHYDAYPAVFEHWDLAWVPHRLGTGEVGGDVIKIYEYRAAGFPVVTTRIIGSQRALPGVLAVDDRQIEDALRACAGAGSPGSVCRDHYVTPAEDTWSVKAARLLKFLGLSPPFHQHDAHSPRPTPPEPGSV